MSEGISYHNKDILFKSLSELYHDSALGVFGLQDLPKIEQLLPNEFPRVKVDDKRSDTLFLLEDGSILMLEYESNDRMIENHLKYMYYAQSILQRYYHEGNELKNIHIVVIYTSDVVYTEGVVNAGDLHIQSKAVLLSDYNGDAILDEIKFKIDHGETLTHDELMKLSILPLMQSAKERQALIHETVEVAKSIQDEHAQLQVLAGILTATDKFIDKAYGKKLREWLKMTKVGRLFEEEKQEAIEKTRQEEREKAKKEKEKLAKSLLDILSPEVVAEKTGLELDEVKKLKKE